tara:strand:- start:2 stop:202 length:201 start_codon:yes stop_codon:yes gene_type:complete
MEKQIKVDISLEDLDLVYTALEAHQPVPIDFFGQSSLNIGDMALYDKVRQVLFRLKEQDDRWVRAQ